MLIEGALAGLTDREQRLAAGKPGTEACGVGEEFKGKAQSAAGKARSAVKKAIR